MCALELRNSRSNVVFRIDALLDFYHPRTLGGSSVYYLAKISREYKPYCHVSIQIPALKHPTRNTTSQKGRSKALCEA